MIFWILFIQTLVLPSAFGSNIVFADNLTPAPRVQRECVFPFLYEGLYHYDCIFVDGDDEGWCSRTNNYDLHRWKTECWRAGDDISEENDQPCVFPFIFKNTTYYECHNLWNDPFTEYGHCGLTWNINTDRRFKYCDEFDGRLLESSEDSECVFPFYYKNELWETCTDIVSASEHGQCATGTYDVNVGRMYRNCTAWDVFLAFVIVEDFIVPCHFPFTFKNTTYHDCTTLIQDTKYGQCSTTPNFDIDGRYRNCTNVIGCHFPFVWQNQIHNDCIYDEYLPWCSRTDNYDRDGMAIACYENDYKERMIEEDDTHECHFPYKYRNRMVNRCINNVDITVDEKFVCATTSSFDRDRKFKYCNQTEIDASLAIRALDYDGMNCKLPFSVDHEDGNGLTVHHGCTTAHRGDIDKPYCGVMEFLNGYTYLGYCEKSAIQDRMDLIVTHMYTYTNKECIFPFEYKGFWFYGCTSFEHPDGLSWCATTKRRSDRNLKTEYPNYKANKYILQNDSFEYDDFDLCVVEENTVISSFGGNAGGAKCHFPFKYKSDWYDKCTHKDTGMGWWCSTTSDYSEEGKWGFCNVKNTDTKMLQIEGSDGLKKKILEDTYDDMRSTRQPVNYGVPNTQCTFPFVYNGKLHFDLMKIYPGQWRKSYCSTTRNYDRDRDVADYPYINNFKNTGNRVPGERIHHSE